MIHTLTIMIVTTQSTNQNTLFTNLNKIKMRKATLSQISKR
jgi:hypothetical protein